MTNLHTPPAADHPPEAPAASSRFLRFRRWMGHVQIQGLRLIDRVLMTMELVWLASINRRQQTPPAFFLDVGASGGISLKWRLAQRLGLVRVGGFEPDAEAAATLRRTFPQTQFLPYALADKDGARPLHLTLSPSCSSCLLPDAQTLSAYPVGRIFEVVASVEIEACTFSSLLDKGLVDQPDFLKIDVQGFEYEVLQGCGRSLERVLGIELESHLKPLYVGERPIMDLMKLLAEHGFILRRFEQQGTFEGECIEANLFFSKRPSELSAAQRHKLAVWEVVSHVPEATVYHFTD